MISNLNLMTWRNHRRAGPVVARFILLFTLVLGITVAVIAYAGGPTDVGYRDFAYGPGGCSANPTADKPESKLWWADGFWWGSLCEATSSDHFVYRLDLATQTWVNTGTTLDVRGSSKADTLWDGNKLYLASHTVQDGGLPSPDPNNWGRLYRYSYNTTTDTYTPDNLGAVPGSNFAYVNNGQTETLTLAKDRTGQLWVTYTMSNTVYINRSLSGDGDWGTPFALPVQGATGLMPDDISSIIAFEDDNGAARIGVMWSNQNLDAMIFATHPDESADTVDWTVDAVYSGSGLANDHVNLKSLQSDSAGNVFAVVKTNVANPAVVLLVCEDGSDCSSENNWQAHAVYQNSGAFEPTRPMLLIDESNRDLYVFVTTPESGGSIYYKSSPIDTIGFPNPADPGTLFIQSSLDPELNNATSTKQNLSDETGLVVLVSDPSTEYYLHNFLCLDPTGAYCPGERTVQFEQSDYSVSEPDGTATITVTLSAPSSGPITVNYATSNGTATAPDDYTTTAGTLLFDPFETSQTFTVPIVDDALDESDESVNLALSAPVGASIGVPGAAILTIADNEGPPTVQFSADNFAVDENGGSATIEVTLSHASAATVTVDYATSDGTATAGDDYTPVNNTLTFTPGDTSQTFDVTIIDNAIDEAAETVNLSLSSPSGAGPGTPVAAVLTILDDDLPPSVQFSSGAYSVNENAGTATIEVTLSGPSGKEVSINYATTNGTATAGEDYEATAGTLTFSPGQSSQSFTIPILNDVVDEDDETVTLTLSAPNNVVIGDPGAVTLTIVDSPIIEYNLFLPVIVRH
jgi:hypothetical protein